MSPRTTCIGCCQRDHAEDPEPRNVRGIDGFDMFDPMPPPARGPRIGGDGALERVERHPDRAIADRVHFDLPAALVHHGDDAIELGR